jgi:hypothetical protein
MLCGQLHIPPPPPHTHTRSPPPPLLPRAHLHAHDLKPLSHHPSLFCPVDLNPSQVTVFKVFAVLLSVGGCAVLSLENSKGGSDKAIGYVWEIGSVILYAVYEVFYKRYCCSKDDPHPTANSQRFFGLCGLLTLLLVWPFFFILDHIKYEVFKWPTHEEAMYIAIVAACDTLFNVSLVVTILLTSPLFTSVGTILVIPLGCLVDYFFKRECPTPHRTAPHPHWTHSVCACAVWSSTGTHHYARARTHD